MRRSDNYVSLLKVFFISARRVPRPPEVPNRHRFQHVSKLYFFWKSNVFLTFLEIRLLSRTCVESISYQCIKKYANRDPVLQDQKVFPEVRNRSLLLRDFVSHSTSRNSVEIPFEIPLEILLAILYVIRYAIKYMITSAMPSHQQNPTPNLLIKL